MSRKLRFLMAWQTYRVGDVIEPNGVLYQTLLGMRWNGKPYVEVVPEREQPAASETESAPTAGKRRGRPPKRSPQEITDTR